MQEDGESPVHVVIRVRPLTARESAQGQKVAWSHDEERIWQAMPGGVGRTYVPPQVYGFDRVYGANESSEVLHKECVAPSVDRAVQGFNATVFAYGQTSSGKTTTIRGTEGCVGGEGLIPLCVKQVLATVEAERATAGDGGTRWRLRMAYLEIYNENIGDLLTGATGLNIYEKKGGGILVQDLREETIHDWARAEELLLKGDTNKHVGCTERNDKSSRAHTVFRLSIERSHADGAVTASELNIVDLAGSERQSAHARVQPKDAERAMRSQEGGHINKSLLVLGTVIQKLSDSKGAAVHVPYRSSKITRILQNSLGGNALSTIVCNVTPANWHTDESHNTLRFAARAKNLHTVLVRQECIEPEKLLRKYEAQIQELKLALSHAQRCGLPSDGGALFLNGSLPRPDSFRTFASYSATSGSAASSDAAAPASPVAAAAFAASAASAACLCQQSSTHTSPSTADVDGSGASDAEARAELAEAQLTTLKGEAEDLRAAIRAERQKSAAWQRSYRLLQARHQETERQLTAVEEELAAVTGEDAPPDNNQLAVEQYADLGEERASSSAVARPPLAALLGAVEGSASQAHERIRQLERENAKLLQRLTLLLHQGGWRAAAAPTAADARKWRHKYMVELLRRASLERRNMQLARQASRLSPHDVAVPPAEVRPLLWDPWEDPGELHELTLPRALARPRLAHLDLAGR